MLSNQKFARNARANIRAHDVRPSRASQDEGEEGEDEDAEDSDEGLTNARVPRRPSGDLRA